MFYQNGVVGAEAKCRPYFFFSSSLLSSYTEPQVRCEERLSKRTVV